MAKGIKRAIHKASVEVRKEIAGYTDRGSLYSRGLAGEGYNGGYLDALQDVLLLLNGGFPCRAPRFWESVRTQDEESKTKK